MITSNIAAVLFHFKRIYNILSCVKQVVGQMLLIFLVNSLERLLARSGGLISLGGLLAATVLKFGKPGSNKKILIYVILVTNVRVHGV